jgi:tripartite ATP-independent transporter DctM subunit
VAARGYDKRLALGSIAAGGTLGILIPPSIIFIVYGTLAEVSIGKLFLAGVLPGLLLGVVYSLYIAVRALFDPRLAPREPASSWSEVAGAVISLWPIWLVVIVVLGGIYGGVASPTEIAALAAALTFIFAAINRKLTFENVRTACLNTVKQTSMILMVIIMAKVLSLTLIYSQVPNMAASWVQSIGATTTLIILAALALYLVMGMFFDGVSMMVITIPFIVPIMNAANVDLVWLGVLICINIEVGLLTPPVGLNLYVLQGSTGEPFRTIVSGSWPFAALQVLAMLIIFMIPAIATWLPNQLF